MSCRITWCIWKCTTCTIFSGGAQKRSLKGNRKAYADLRRFHEMVKDGIHSREA